MIKLQTAPTPEKKMIASPAAEERMVSIDILRALTMVLMIFVNDLWSLQNIPQWLEHVAPGVDGIGLADVVFPAFLFIVGLSLPFAMDQRRRKGESDPKLAWHVVVRTIGLLVMGVFLVNGETINASAMGIPKWLWYPLCCLCFIILWNAYPKTAKQNIVVPAKVAAIGTLVILAIMYRGGTDGQARFEPHWWGILGLIGWAYLASGLMTVFSRNNLVVILMAWLFFAGLSIVAKAGWLPKQGLFTAVPDAIRGGTLTALTLGGVLTSLIFRFYRKQKDNIGLSVVLVLFSLMLFVLSIVTRPYWKLAKLGATPAWLFLCSGFTVLAFLAIYWLADYRKKSKWFTIINPAGANTLLCYLIPYFAYAITSASGLHLPAVLLTGGVGLLKSLLFALLCVAITGWLTKAGVKLKL